MPLRIGDKSIPFDGIYDESDGFDAPEGTFASLNNYIPNRNKSSLVGRGAFVKYVDPPSSSNGGIVTNSNSNLNTMSIFKVLHVGQFYVTKPSNQLVTVMAAVCSFDTHSAGTTTNYMLRFFMNPSISGGVFGASTTWKDVTPYYIDLVYSATLLSGAGQDYTFPSGTALFPNGGIYAPDLYGGYIYVEDNTFATPLTHDAEGDKIVAHTNTYYYSNGTPTIGIRTESSHPGSFSTWGGVTMNTIRVHKNLETGKIPYQDLVSTSSTFFDTYSFSDFTLNEKYCLSINTGISTRASLTLSLNYVNTTFFGTSNIWGRADYIYDGGGVASDWLYDKHLVYGFPNYENINKANSEAVFQNKTINVYATGTAPQTGATVTSNVVNVATSYKPIAGRLELDFAAYGAPATNDLYKLNSCDVSVIVNDFVMTEFDVHGRYGGYKDFELHSDQSTGYNTMEGVHKRYNFVEYTSVNDEVAAVTSETGWAAGDYLHMIGGGVYDGFRYGMHSEKYHKATGAGTMLVAYKIPSVFNRNLTSVFFTSTTAATSASQITSSWVALNSKTAMTDNIVGNSGYDFRLTYVDVAGNLQQNGGYFYSKVYRLDVNKLSNASIGGNHLSITGNPSYAKGIVDNAEKSDLVLSSYGITSSGLVSDNYPGYILTKDYSFGCKQSVTIRDRLFLANARFQEFQKGSIQSTVFDDSFNVFFSPSAEFGGSYHPFDANTLKIPAKDISPITGLAVSNIPQGLDSATQPDKNNLLILGERGYKYVDLADNITANWSTVTYNGDACIAPKSVVSENGLVFCAGMNGVYMFQGAKKTDITKLGNSRYNKTWRTLSETMKRSAVGAYYRDRNVYALTVFGATGRQIICFDLDLRCIYFFTHGNGGTLDKTIGSGYAGGKWFNFYSDGLITNYDENSVIDDIIGSTRDVVATFLTNNFSPKSDWSKLDYIGIKASKLGGGSNTFGIYCDGSSYNPGNVVSLISTPSYLRWKVKRDFASRGTRFAFGMSSHTYNAPEIHDIDVSFSDVPQKKMIKGAK